jgi:hypothetical protein
MHPIHEQKDKNTEQVVVQSLFIVLGKGFFMVSPSLREISPNSAFSTLISNILPNRREKGV